MDIFGNCADCGCKLLGNVVQRCACQALVCGNCFRNSQCKTCRENLRAFPNNCNVCGCSLFDRFKRNGVIEIAKCSCGSICCNQCFVKCKKYFCNTLECVKCNGRGNSKCIKHHKEDDDREKSQSDQQYWDDVNEKERQRKQQVSAEYQKAQETMFRYQQLQYDH
jgi:hypothetical protein